MGSPRNQRGICPNCDFVGTLRKDGKVPKHAANESCDGAPVEPGNTWLIERRFVR